MKQLTKGNPAPEFELLDQNEKPMRLADYRGKKLLIFFYPRANTPGCTRQACSVSHELPHFTKIDVQALGISPDKPSSQKKFDEKHTLGFPLLSDTDHQVAQAYGAWGEKKSGGKTKAGIIRSAFLVDEQGKIIDSWYKVKPEDTVPNTLSVVSA